MHFSRFFRLSEYIRYITFDGRTPDRATAILPSIESSSYDSDPNCVSNGFVYDSSKDNIRIWVGYANNKFCSFINFI